VSVAVDDELLAYLALTSPVPTDLTCRRVVNTPGWFIVRVS